MNLPPKQQRTLEELSSLPPDHTERQAFVATLPQLDETTRAAWSTLVHEAEHLRAALQRINPPADLHATLLAIPRQAPPLSIKPSWAFRRMLRPLAAAVLLVLIGIGGYTYWRASQPVDDANFPAAPQRAVEEIIQLAVNTHRSAPPLEILSNNREEVRAALQAKVGKDMPFPVLLPNPGANYHLLGGSICDFGAAKAVETRWQYKDHLYTLLQFSPAPFGMPRQFATLRQSPPTQQLAMADFSVTIWPGAPDGICTWAVVGDRKAPPEPFSVAAY